MRSSRCAAPRSSRGLWWTIACFAAFAAAGPLAAQDEAADTADATERSVLERLRALSPATGGVLPPGSDTLPDTLDADTLADTTGAIPPVARGDADGPVGGGPADSIMRELLLLEGYAPLAYTADSARFDADSGRVWLLGTSELDRSGQGMQTDSLMVYDFDTEIVCGFGEPTITGGEQSPVVSRQVCYNVGRRIGRALQARTTFQQGGVEWRLGGDELYPVGNSRVFVHDAEFTSCTLEIPHYHFAAREAKMVRDSVMVARDITLNFADVPVFWLPFMVQSMRDGRRSGLLTPDFSTNFIASTSAGYRRRISNIGFYWAISDYMGAELSFGWHSDTWTEMQGRFDYRVLRRFLDGGVVFRQFWEAEGGRRLTLRSRNSWQPDERTNVQLNADYASSADFVRRNTFDPRELNRSLQSNVSVGRRFAGGGSVDVSAERKQYLTDGRVETSLPVVGLSLPSVSLFQAPPGQAGWYNNASWRGSASFSSRATDVDEIEAGRRQQDEVRRVANVQSTFNMGDFSWRQRFDLNRRDREPRSFEEDTVPDLPESFLEELDWSSGLDYTQRLIGTSSFTPGLRIRGVMLRSDSTAGERIPGPTRIDFTANLQTSVYGFWPGVGPFSRIRHRIQPRINYNYSPEPDLSDRQQEFFDLSGLREQNAVSLTLSQTFEAKYREEEEEEEVGAAADDAPGDIVVDDPTGGIPGDPADDDVLADAVPGAAAGEPQRVSTGRKITLLSLSTSAIAYDWVRAREEGFGFTRTTLENSMRSDLLRGFSVRITHDLFETPDAAGEEIESTPRFSPHLSGVNASFSVDNDSWLFRTLGLGGDPEAEEEEDAGVADTLEMDADEGLVGADDDRLVADERGGQLGLLGGERGRGAGEAPGMGGAGDWSASLTYSLLRPRDEAIRDRNQMIQGTLRFQPTAGWSVNWRTGYSVTDREFSDHVVTLTRDLHRWQANFDFVKVQNGNFSLQFRVSLRDNPDLKVEYEQRSDPPRTRSPRGF